MTTKNKAINDLIRAKAGRNVSKVKKDPAQKKNQAVNDMIRTKAGKR